MTMFDPIIAEADERFDLKGKAGTLLSTLLALMTGEANGGFSGFLQKFRLANLDDAVSSWINSGANKEISNEQLESALGVETLNGISKQIGADYTTTVSGAAFIIPRVIDVLMPDGVMPNDSDLLSRIGGTLNGVEEPISTAETFDRAGIAASVPTANTKEDDNSNAIDRNVKSLAKDSTDSAEPASYISSYANNSPLNWLLPLILLGLLLVTGYWFCSRLPEQIAPAKENTDAASVTNTNQIAANQ
jgi:uncharacterized protein YidB (DUF937 family)